METGIKTDKRTGTRQICIYLSLSLYTIEKIEYYPYLYP